MNCAITPRSLHKYNWSPQRKEVDEKIFQKIMAARP